MEMSLGLHAEISLDLVVVQAVRSCSSRATLRLAIEKFSLVG